MPKRQWQDSHPDRFAALRDGLIAQALNREPIARGTELAALWRQGGVFGIASSFFRRNELSEKSCVFLICRIRVEQYVMRMVI